MKIRNKVPTLIYFVGGILLISLVIFLFIPDWTPARYESDVRIVHIFVCLFYWGLILLNKMGFDYLEIKNGVLRQKIIVYTRVVILPKYSDFRVLSRVQGIFEGKAIVALNNETQEEEIILYQERCPLPLKEVIEIIYGSLKNC
jgi:hypothetical protein